MPEANWAPFRVENPEHRDGSQGRGGDGSQKGIRKHVQSNEKGDSSPPQAGQNDSPQHVNSRSEATKQSLPKQHRLKMVGGIGTSRCVDPLCTPSLTGL